MSVQTPVDKTSPLWKAWEAYKVTEHYANTKKWAATSHVEGSLWAAFERGFAAAAVERGVRETPDTERLDWWNVNGIRANTGTEGVTQVWYMDASGEEQVTAEHPSFREAIDEARESDTARSGRREDVSEKA